MTPNGRIGALGRRLRRAAGLAIMSAAAVFSADCRDGLDRLRADAAGGGEEATSRRLLTIVGFDSPESVTYDPELDVYYVSNMRLFGSLKDGNGFISRLEAGDPARASILVEGGINGVTLHAPKGIAIHGDTLWVADIDALRGFHRVTGAPLATIDLAAHRPTLLNDVAVGPNGTIRTTDTGIIMAPWGTVYDTTGDRHFGIGPGRAITAIAAGAPYPKPNGITWDEHGRRWLVVTFEQFRSVLYAMADGDSARTPLAEGAGRWDGVEALGDGRIVLSSWSDSSIYVLDSSGGAPRRIVRGVPEPADLGIDTRRRRIAIPLALSNRVELWTIPPPRRDAARRAVPVAER